MRKKLIRVILYGILMFIQVTGTVMAEVDITKQTILNNLNSMNITNNSQAIAKIEGDKKLAVDKEIREKLIAVYMRKDSNSGRAGLILLETQSNKLTKKNKVYKFDRNQENEIMKKIKSNKDERFFEGLKEFEDVYNIAQDKLLTDEGYIVEVNKKFFRELYVEIKKNSKRYKRLESKLAGHLLHICPECYDEELDVFLGGSRDVQIFTLNYLKNNKQLALIKADRILKLVEDKDDEIKQLALEVILHIDDEVVRKKVVNNLFDVTDVVDSLKNLYGFKSSKYLENVIDEQCKFFIAYDYRSTNRISLETENNNENGYVGDVSGVESYMLGEGCLAYSRVQNIELVDKEIIEVDKRKYKFINSFEMKQYTNHIFKKRFLSSDCINDYEPCFSLNFSFTPKIENGSPGCRNTYIIGVCLKKGNRIVLIGFVGNSTYKFY